MRQHHPPRQMERMVPVPYHYRPHHRTRGVNFISPCLTYTMFFFNFIFWLVGGVFIGIGLYAVVDQFKSGEGALKVDRVEDVLFNVGIVITVIGVVIFMVSFFGCIGALRENCLLLKAYSIALLIFFLLELGVAILCFVYPNKVEGLISNYLTDNVIQKYREDADLQNLIDFVQQEFHCCGLSSRSYEDWSKNEYFNCTKPELNQSVERCGVPYSCCKNATDMSSGLINIMCGYGVQKESDSKELLVNPRRGSPLLQNDAKDKVWTQGCIDAMKSWINRHLYIVAGAALGFSLMQLFVMYLAKSLEGQIDLQKAN